MFTDFLLTLCEGCFSVDGIFSSSCVRVVLVLTDFSPHIVFPGCVNFFFSFFLFFLFLSSDVVSVRDFSPDVV